MFSFFAYLKYLFRAVNEHGIHSPSLYTLYIRIIRGKSNQDFSEIENLYKKSLVSNQIIGVTDLGAGSKSRQGSQRSIRSIAKYSVSIAKKSQLQYRLLQYFKPNVIIELGTSLGLNTSYMAQAVPEAKIYTLEGSPEIAEIAKQNFKELNISNVELRIGNFNETFPQVLKHVTTLTRQYVNASIYIYFDGNHRLKPTLQYFNEALTVAEKNTIMVFDDIHWSGEMQEAWKQISNHPSVTMALDLYVLGIVFFDKALSKQNFILRF